MYELVNVKNLKLPFLWDQKIGLEIFNQKFSGFTYGMTCWFEKENLEAPIKA